jgi:spermidine synthase
VHDVAVASYTAVTINFAIAAIGWHLAAGAPHREEARALETAAGKDDWNVYLAIAVSGLCSLGAEVIWTRQLSLLLGGTVYTFSLILAGFLAGIGAGGGAGAFVAVRGKRPRLALGICQFLLGGAIAWSAYVLANVLPYWNFNSRHQFTMDFLSCAAAILPAALLWGASFPLALAAAANKGLDATRATSRIYATNTLGAIVGVLLFSLLLIPGIGTQQAQRLLIGLSAAASVIALVPKRIALAGVAGVLFAWFVPALPWGVIAYGRQLSIKDDIGTLMYAGEGMNASIAITQLYDKRLFHVSGKVEASSEQQDMRLQRMLGHIPALFHPKPRSALVVGCGAGVTAGSFLAHPSIEKITLCEIEPLVLKTAARYFDSENYNVIEDRRTQIVNDDARHYILTTRDTFDVITSDPIHPWVKGSATLYTKEYFELCKRRLNPGGFITQWVPLYESNREAVMSEIATFFEVFPNGTIWGNDTDYEEGYDVVLLGQQSPARIDADALQQRLDRPDHSRVTKSLRELGLGTAIHLLSTYAGDAEGLRGWLRDAQINRDRNLRLQYLAGLAPNAQGAVEIYHEILRFRKFPEYIVTASQDRAKLLKGALRGQY